MIGGEKMKVFKKEYTAPEVIALLCERDIITYSETEEWEGPIIVAAEEDN